MCMHTHMGKRVGERGGVCARGEVGRGEKRCTCMWGKG